MPCDRSPRRAGSNWGRLARQVSCPARRGTQRGGRSTRVMLRLLHTADVHLGARHADLGDRAATQRERQFAAFVATVDLALEEKVDLVLIAGDLFDSNTQPRRSVERAAAQIKRLVDARIRVVIAPGTHDVYDKASIYRAFDLPALAGAVGSDLVTVLDPDHHDVHLQALDLVVHGRCYATKRAPESPLAGLDASTDDRATWHVGLLHAAVAIEGRTDGDDVVIRTDGDRGEPSRLPRPRTLALDLEGQGRLHGLRLRRRAGADRARPGPRRERAARDAGWRRAAGRRWRSRSGKVGKTTFERVQLDAATVGTQPALVAPAPGARQPGPRARRRADRRPARRAGPARRGGRGASSRSSS